MIWTPGLTYCPGIIGGLGASTTYILAFTAWGQRLTLARIWLPLTRRLPWDTVAFLENAYHLGVLRHAGAVYQFRHNQLQRHLTHTYHNPERPTASARPERR
ncbi:hypothetical protein [Streptomyces roseolilacinus]|nr:hypothetical protein [Streptomyces roseolilacinus]